jgi:hypothetical protein
MAQLLTTASSMMCPHGGQVQAVSSNTRAKAGVPILRGSDTFTILGCPLNVAGAPHPCVTVQWVKTNLRSKAAGDFVLASDSVGLCLAGDQAPQGTVMVSNTQAKVSGL